VPASRAGAAGRALAARKLLHVPDAAAAGFVARRTDLGPRAVGPRWEHASLLLLPIAAGADEPALCVLSLARAEGGVGAEDTELAAWLAAVLGGVLQQTIAKRMLEVQLALLGSASAALVALASRGIELRDPSFWLDAFRAQTAQIVFVFPRAAPGGRAPLALYATSRDISREGAPPPPLVLSGHAASLTPY